MIHIDLNDIIVLYISESNLDKHIHESDTKSNNDKQEVADETIEKIDQTPNIKKFECSVCKQKYASQSNLNEHISSFHDLNENDVQTPEGDVQIPKQTTKDENNTKLHDELDVTDETIEKILDEHIQAVHDSDVKSDLETNEIPMQDLNKHIHESDAKSIDDKQEVADVTIEKI